MHEQQHSEEEVVSREKPKNIQNNREESIRQVAEPMQIFALENSLLTHAATSEAVQRGKFSKLIQIQQTVLLHVILNISPADNEALKPFWHCSMSLVSGGSRKPKTFNLWTKRERLFIRDLLPRFLDHRGLKPTQGFMQTKTALHCHRELTAEEFNQLKGN